MHFKNNLAFKAFNTNNDGTGLDVKEVRSKAKQLGLFSSLDAIDEASSLDQNPAARGEGTDEISQFLSASDDSVRLSNLMSDKVSAIVNKNREVSIGDKVYKLQNDYVFSYKKGDAKLVKEFYAALKGGRTPKPTESKPTQFGDLTVLKSIVHIVQIGGGNDQSNGRSHGKVGCVPHFGPNFRLVGEAVTWSYGVVAGAYVHSVAQFSKKRFWWFIWSDFTAQNLFLSYDVNLYVTNGTSWPSLVGRFSETRSWSASKHLKGFPELYNFGKYTMTGTTSHSVIHNNFSASCTNFNFSI
ncbi:MAG: hypothetical protein ACKO1F_08535 [Flammeovirgaceae bacterium]